MKKDISTLTGTSDEAVKNATGKGWNEWVEFLDNEGANDLSHKGIVAKLSSQLENGWWCQQIAVGYEKLKGKRVLGQTADAGFQLGVSKTFNIGKDRLWEIIASKDGIAIWLGHTGDSLAGPGMKFNTKEGISGEVRVFKPSSHFRMTWQPKDWNRPSVLQLRAMAKGDKSVLSFHHEGLPNVEARAAMKNYWTERIKGLTELIGKN